MTTDAHVSETGENIRRYLIIGLAAVAILVGGMFGWAAFASIAGAVIAQGNVVVETYSKKVQHLQGGIVGEILVQDGDRVAPGDLLLKLDDILPRASLAIIQAQLDELFARRARLEAEQGGEDTLDLPEQLSSRMDIESVQAIADGQRQLLQTQSQSLAGQKAQLEERIGQSQTEIRGLEAQQQAKGREIELIADELEGMLILEAKNLVPKSRVAALQREAARLEGERGQFIAEIARAEGRISETRLQILQIDRDRLTQVVTELRDVQVSIAELNERRIAAEEDLRRIDMRSPIGGIVHQLAFHTVGGVIPPGETVLEIVPAKDNLLVEARLAPADIDQVFIGQEAAIKFPSFSQRTTPEINGTVTQISADVSVDPALQVQYYRLRIAIPAEELDRLEGLTLIPGMPAEVFIQTGSRTALSYLVKPLKDQITRAFREE